MQEISSKSPKKGTGASLLFLPFPRRLRFSFCALHEGEIDDLEHSSKDARFKKKITWVVTESRDFDNTPPTRSFISSIRNIRFKHVRCDGLMKHDKVITTLV